MIQCSFQRYEKKYLLTPAQYEAVRAGMQSYMTPDAYSKYTICNVYYDTDDFRLIRTSLEKPVYKEKLRVRSYGTVNDAGRVFVELKKKFDGVVYKRRVVMEAADAVAYLAGREPGDDTQIFREIDWFMHSYQPAPKVFIAYDREAFAGTGNPDLRVTFDTRLRGRTEHVDLRSGDYGQSILGGNQILMEIKIPGAAPLWLARLLSDNHIVSTSFSKYGAYYKRYILTRQTAPAAYSYQKEVLSVA
ncbi:MAG: polyphosphate polymerase domain-containing protein [Oscillospiraceae bacterium]|nr:polyphosphate polymerase domain-containing protein [Oscillospiraceae bacterium]